MSRRKPAAPPKPRPGPKPSGVVAQLVRLTPEEWEALDAIALEHGLGDARGGRTHAIRHLIAQHRE